MQSRRLGFLIIICLSLSLLGWGQIQGAPPDSTPANPPIVPVPGVQKSGGDFSNVTHPDPKKVVPKDTIIVKGAWYSSTDSTIPSPEGATVANNVFSDPYFGITYSLPSDWIQKFTPPPPSDTGSYVLAQIRRPDNYQGEARGNIQFTAQDMFFTPIPASNVRQFVNYAKNHLMADYQLELKPSQTAIAGQPFTFFAYWSPAAQLHWYVLATQIRCHVVEFILMNHEPKALEDMVRDMSANIKLPADAGTGGGNFPVCVKDYATGENVIERVEPVFPQHRYNSIPVRILIDKEGKVKYIHFITAFPEQERAITEALRQWKFRPYERDGQRLEVETGLTFGRPAVPVPIAGDRASD